MAFMVLDTIVEATVEILQERADSGGSKSVLVKKPGQPQPEWVSGSDIVEIKRLPRGTTEKSASLTKAEQLEYRQLFKTWTTDGGKGAELLTPAQIARFSELNDRVSSEGV